MVARWGRTDVRMVEFGIGARLGSEHCGRRDGGCGLGSLESERAERYLYRPQYPCFALRDTSGAQCLAFFFEVKFGVAEN